MNRHDAMMLALLAAASLDGDVSIRNRVLETPYKKCACGRTTTAANGICPRCASKAAQGRRRANK